MSFLTDLYAFLTTDDTSELEPDRAAAVELVRSKIHSHPVPPGQAEWRLYPKTLREGSPLDALTYQLVDNPTTHQMSGESTGLYQPRVQIDVYSQTYSACDTLAKAVKKALDGFIGIMGSTEINVLLHDNELEDYESDRLQYHRTHDFLIFHNPAE